MLSTDATCVKGVVTDAVGMILQVCRAGLYVAGLINSYFVDVFCLIAYSLGNNNVIAVTLPPTNQNKSLPQSLTTLAFGYFLALYYDWRMALVVTGMLPLITIAHVGPWIVPSSCPLRLPLFALMTCFHTPLLFFSSSLLLLLFTYDGMYVCVIS